MNLSEPFIKRPVMTTLVMVAILVFGIFSFFRLPISDMPSFTSPTILVTANNPGSDAALMASTIATPLEQQLMTIEGLESIISQSRTGTTEIVCVFSLDRSIDGASTDVSRAINQAAGYLPKQMPTPPTYQKFNPSDTPIIYIALSSESMPLYNLYDYANNALAQRFSMIDGVSEVTIYGAQRAVRVKLNPDQLAAYNLGIDEVARAVVEGNQSQPAGTVYNELRQYTLNPLGQLTEGDEYNELIIAYRNGAPVRVRDIGEAINDIANENLSMKYWNRETGEKPSIVLAVTKQSGFNTVEICGEIKEMLAQMRQAIPTSISTHIVFDTSVGIRAAIRDVEFTLLFAFALVVLVIFLFLGNASSTLIPSLALPMAIIGTFMLMYILGYSIDILSMLGLILVVGFLVDDAIVVLENTVRHTEMGKTPYQAALDSSKQISTTVFSMTLSLAAVFTPFIFMPGIIGRMFHEFAMVVVIAVLFSGALSLTLTPVLLSRMLRPSKRKTRITDWLIRLYVPMLGWVLRRRWVPITASAAGLAIALLLFASIPQDFLPAGDTGAIQGTLIAVQGESPLQLKGYQEELIETIKKNPYVDNIISVVNVTGTMPANEGVFFVMLVEESKRPPIDEVVSQLEEALAQFPGFMAYMMPFPELNLSIGTTLARANYQFAISTIEDSDELYQAVEKLTAAMQEMPELSSVSSDILIDNPQLDVTILRDQATTYGVSAEDVENAINLGYAEGQLALFYTPINTYQVIMELQDQFRQQPSSLDKLYVTPTDPNAGETLVPLNAVADWKETTGPLTVNHVNHFTSATIFFNTAPHVALGTALKKIDKAAAKILPSTLLREFQGQAAVFRQTMGPLILLVVVGIFVIYILLGILYESFLDPLTILSALPGALFGALLTLFLFRATLSIYAYVGIIVLIGIVMKNGIMLVEFANELRREGKSAYDAIVSACTVRFRPILMTTIAAAMGAVPIALGFGADAASRRPLGLVILGGLLIAQFITYFFTPVVYLALNGEK